MKYPNRLFRFRPLTDELLEREVKALEDSYLFSPLFSKMNDPMEAYYETGGPADHILDGMLAPVGKSVRDMYELLDETVRRFACVSFAATYTYLPMWAYYASNFSGMCLEFDPVELFVGDFQGEKLRQVTYAQNALSSISVTDVTSARSVEAILARMTRKRVEWRHEREWRFITGQSGAKHYLDDALRRVFLGPRVSPKHAARICEVLDRRPVEVLQGEIRGFELEFRTVKPARPLNECERVGAGSFSASEHLYAEKEIRAFLSVPYERLLDECHRTALRPNMDELGGVDLATNRKAIYLWTTYKLRSGHIAHHKRYFDHKLRQFPADD